MMLSFIWFVFEVREIVWLFFIIWNVIWLINLVIIGFIFFGMIEELGWWVGRLIFFRFVWGSEVIKCRLFVILDIFVI